MTRVLTTVLLGGVLVVATSSPAAADEENFLVPGVDASPPGWFVAFFVLALVMGVGSAIYKVTMARDLARKSGMDPHQATAITLLEDDGLEATYLASNLRTPAGSTQAQPPGVGRSVSERLAELTSLRDQGLVTQAEYDARRAAILDSL